MPLKIHFKKELKNSLSNFKTKIMKKDRCLNVDKKNN